MDSFDANHEETRTDLPFGPLARSPWSFLNWGLPATAVSVISICVFWGVLAWLHYQGLRRLPFQLPLAPLWLAIPAAALAWNVAIRCSRRPGRLLPRLWALALALIAAANVGFASTPAVSGASWLHALIVAVLAAALTLTTRLFRLWPSSHLIRMIGPLCLLGVFAVILPPVSWLSRAAAAAQERQVDDRIRYLLFWTSEVRAVTAYDWSRFTESPDLAREQIDRLAAIPSERLLGGETIWRAATRLERDGELSRAGRALIDAVTAAVAPGVPPKTSTLSEPAVWDDPAAGTRILNEQFSRMSGLAGDYHQEIGRIFLALGGGGASGSRPRRELEAHYRSRGLAFGDALKDLSESWADQWLVFAMPRPADIEVEGSLAALLARPLNRADRLAPADLWRMLRLSFTKARALAQRKNGCYGRQDSGQKDESFLLDCFAYRAADRGADVRVELRLVYVAQNHGRLAGQQWPSALYFHFPLLEGLDEAASLDQTMDQLASAVRLFWHGALQPIDGSSLRSGFIMRDDGSEIWVESGGLADYDGQRQAAVVRAKLSL